MLDETRSLIRTNSQARSRLQAVLAGGSRQDGWYAGPHTLAGETYDVVITPNEVNRRHGTGVLVQHIFGNSENVISIRSRNDYLGEHDFGAASFCLMTPDARRSEIFARVGNWFWGSNPRRVICIPYYPEDLNIAIAVKELFEIPLCLYIMDDNNLHHAASIPDTLMAEALRKASFRIAISSEMQKAYENKYRLKFWTLPPVVSSELIKRTIDLSDSSVRSQLPGVLIGNIWSQKWLEQLRDTIKGTGVKVDWFCNGGMNGLSFNKDELRSAGITLREPMLERDLVPAIRDRPFALMPSGSLQGTAHAESVAKYSLPSRLAFIIATCNTPIIVLGSKTSAAARFVTRVGVGTVCDYTADAFRVAFEAIVKPDAQASMRAKAFALGKYFSAAGVSEWIWQSSESGQPIDDRYDVLTRSCPDQFAHYIEPPVPATVYHDFVSAYQALRRLTRNGYEPDFVVDIGSSTGIWSHTVHTLFPHARFILVDPLASRYREASKWSFGAPNAEFVEAVVTNRAGRVQIQVSSDLYNSSLLHINVGDLVEAIEVPAVTLDSLAHERKLCGRGLVKIDAQFAEHLIIEGGTQLLAERVDVLIVELTLERAHPEAKTFLEILNLLDGLGFRYADDVGSWRSPVNGFLQQKDALFLRKELSIG
jgi:FkbM family methyltransferase